jgi:hypothetical protein
MAVGQSSNCYLAHLAQSLASNGSETIFYVDKITTLTGETLTTADFSIFGKGTITIDPLSTTNIEFCSFTAVDGTNIAFTGGVRGLSAFDYTASTSRAKYHPVGTTVIIAFGVHNLLDLVSYVAGQVAGTIGTATNLVTGSTKLSVAAASPTIPIAVGDNDPRVPTAGQALALVGNGGTPGSGNTFVTQTAFASAFLKPNSGTGADGALSVTSGTTTLNDAGHVSGNFAIYNFTTGSISSGATLAFGSNFANKTIVLKFTGTCTNAGTITTVGNGGAGGVANTNGSLGANACAGVGMTGSGVTAGVAAVGVGYGAYDFSCGNGGGGGTNGGNYSGGAGGAGGGALVIISASTITISGTVNTSGSNGSNAQTTGSAAYVSGGGAGGAGGGAGNQVFIAPTIVTTNGTFTANGGTAGLNTQITGGNGGSANNTFSGGGASGGGSGKNGSTVGTNGTTSSSSNGGTSTSGANGSPQFLINVTF